MVQKYSRKIKVAILIGRGFDEFSLLSCLKTLQLEQTPFRLVSLAQGLYFGQLGLATPTDLTVQAWCATFDYLPQLVVIPGPLSYASKLFLDPRILKFIEETLTHSGKVSASAEAQGLLLAIDEIFLDHHQQLIVHPFPTGD